MKRTILTILSVLVLSTGLFGQVALPLYTGLPLYQQGNGLALLARGMSAERDGALGEALICYTHAVALDPTLTEAAQRLQALTDRVLSGSVNKKADWYVVFKNLSSFFKMYLPFEIIYDPVLTVSPPYMDGTKDVSFSYGVWPETSAYKVLNTIIDGIIATGNAADWQYASWLFPAGDRNAASDAILFPEKTSKLNVVFALQNERGDTVATSGTEINVLNGSFEEGRWIMPQPNAVTVVFENVRTDSDNLSLRIKSVNSVDAKVAMENGMVKISTADIRQLFLGDSNFMYSWLDDGNVAIAGMKSYGGSVTIPSSVSRWKITGIGKRAFANKQLSGVTIPEGIEFIGEEAFYVNNMESINFPKSLKQIGDWAFFSNKLKKVSIPSGIKTLNNGVFSDNQIEDLSLSNGIVSIGEYAFYDNKIKQLSLPDTVTSIAYRAFYSNEISQLKLGQRTEIIGDSAFAFNKISSLTLPPTLGVIGVAAFSGNLIDSLSLGDKLTSIGDSAFYNNRIQELKLGASIENIGTNAFYDNKITSLVVPAKVQSIGSRAFYNNELSTVQIAANVNLYNSAINFGFVDYYDSSSKAAGVYNYSNGAWKRYNNREELRMAQVRAQGTATEVKPVAPPAPVKTAEAEPVVSDEGPETLSAPPAANAKATVAEMPESLKPSSSAVFTFEKGEIKDYTGSSKDVVIPSSINGEPVISIGQEAFVKKGINSVYIPDTVVSIALRAFADNSIKNLVLPGSVVRMGTQAFAGNPLESITISGIWNFKSESEFFPKNFALYFNNNGRRGGTYNYVNSGWMWSPPEIHIPKGETEISERAFYNYQMVSVSIPEGIKKIGELAFAANQLYTVSIPDSVISIGKGAFNGNNQLTSIVIGKGVDSISELAFRNKDDSNSKVTSIVMPEGVSLLIEEFGVFPLKFDSFYNANGRKAGTYTYRDGAWTL
ncbi:MAG: leucine-rich repeat protein [Spirochaetaceae bacterium]|nr:leucine-rich repeat protein [Spirochaetaceae bacterium]